ncbi:MAG TPA: hypothetical protein VEO54_28520 [Thermoanaerobaculia bacterium]|nr:hypothetical protein [Thermoanaerobaculia bacterium]
MRVIQRMFWCIAAAALFSCGGAEEAPALPAAVTHTLGATPHRLSVVFWPETSGCVSCDHMISEVIAGWQKAPDAQMVVVTVVPDRARASQPWHPGVVVRLTAEDYGRYGAGSPLPRVEIRNAKGAVLLSRSIPNNGLQADLLTEEMLAARSFTAPISVAAQ